MSAESKADTANVAQDPEGLSFEDALARLETIVRELEAGTVDLSKALTAYEEGVALKRQCEARLNEARMTVERIAGQSDGSVSTEPFDADQAS